MDHEVSAGARAARGFREWCDVRPRRRQRAARTSMANLLWFRVADKIARRASSPVASLSDWPPGIRALGGEAASCRTKPAASEPLMGRIRRITLLASALAFSA